MSRPQSIESADVVLAAYHREQEKADALEAMADALEELYEAAEPAQRPAMRVAFKAVRDVYAAQEVVAENAFERAKRAALRES